MKFAQYPDVFDAINDLEHNFPVDTWMIGGFHFWPLLRIQIGKMLFRELIKSKANSVERTSKSGIKIPHFVLQLLFMIKDFVNEVSISMKDRKSNSRLRCTDLFFFIQNVDRQLWQGKWWDRFSDAYMAMAGTSLSWSAIEWTSPNRSRIPRHNPSRFVQSQINACRVRARLASTKKTIDEIMSLSGFIALSERVRGFASDTSQIEPRHLARLVVYLLTLEKFFGKVLSQCRPKIGFAPCYYGIEGLAFNLACHKRHIISVDLQHGVAGNGNIAYGRWHKTPKEGYEILPRVFWSWSQDDANAVNEWARQTQSAHVALNGGNPWLMHMKSSHGAIDSVPSGPGRIGDGRISVLISLSGASLSDRISLPGWLLELLKEGHTSILWHVRRHPTNKEMDLSCINADHRNDMEIRLATNLPLPVVLDKVDVHVTEWSAVAIDALALGIPTIVVHEIGHEIYAKQIREGSIKYARNREEFLNYVLDRDFLGSARVSQQASPEAFYQSFESLIRMAYPDRLSEKTNIEKRHHENPTK